MGGCFFIIISAWKKTIIIYLREGFYGFYFFYYCTRCLGYCLFGTLLAFTTAIYVYCAVFVLLLIRSALLSNWLFLLLHDESRPELHIYQQSILYKKKESSSFFQYCLLSYILHLHLLLPLESQRSAAGTWLGSGTSPSFGVVVLFPLNPSPGLFSHFHFHCPFPFCRLRVHPHTHLLYLRSVLFLQLIYVLTIEQYDAAKLGDFMILCEETTDLCGCLAMSWDTAHNVQLGITYGHVFLSSHGTSVIQVI